MWLAYEYGYGVSTRGDYREWANAIDRFNFIYPLRDSAFFLQFAHLIPTPELLLAFSNRFGSLFDTDCAVPFTEMEYEVNVLYFWVTVWKQLRRGRLNDDVLRCLPPEDKSDALTIFLQSGFVPWSPIVKPEDYEEPPRAHHSNIILNDNTNSLVNVSAARLYDTFQFYAMMLLATLDDRLNVFEHDVRLSRNSEPSEGPLRIDVVPRSLLGGIWTQFAAAVAGNLEFRSCFVCNTWFELSPETNRTNRMYCSDACRTRAHRKRKAIEAEMAKEFNPAFGGAVGVSELGDLLQCETIKGEMPQL